MTDQIVDTLAKRNARPTTDELFGVKPHNDFVVKSDGQFATAASGMHRSTVVGKTDYTTIANGPMFDRWAEHLTKGAKVYPDLPDGTPNWMLANGPEEMIRAKKSAFRHFRQWMRGDRDEDHAAAVYFNLNLYEYVRDRLAAENPPA